MSVSSSIGGVLLLAAVSLQACAVGNSIQSGRSGLLESLNVSRPAAEVQEKLFPE